MTTNKLCFQKTFFVAICIILFCIASVVVFQSISGKTISLNSRAGFGKSGDNATILERVKSYTNPQDTDGPAGNVTTWVIESGQACGTYCISLQKDPNGGDDPIVIVYGDDNANYDSAISYPNSGRYNFPFDEEITHFSVVSGDIDNTFVIDEGLKDIWRVSTERSLLNTFWIEKVPSSGESSSSSSSVSDSGVPPGDENPNPTRKAPSATPGARDKYR
ncbi:hypothetical protein A2334_01730 [Candidatus Roizmanbacteria bacterium RIFOXYB2_FULL_38_10]|uniref:Uncharacterized protein n=1 Tax=Candidatus Roizmanbacteria bacterium RIFOXYD1_FULL_38_12 TaxID=1802093 RepID=A0A1F7L1U4_9BACT|nr:MAG: hypothetical protein A3K47_04790 [Candidatus Roizmanbacteria bacterium RIFOXYA2_FULL_38_14]OGK64066.1 MAG: hypothetical protein A3K27_04790 [Candidatus Roizmanbacteria bacterium RIFOXYA1_FULL_37_12]OGK65912.1 MAG: hypothetical protein A3K38_04790 [Candidatus Roizmanbacteria bacterium RIFOXYB1_FULL_40_23]OGK68065.1 MAG: hypothetical protein A2334_01730 [Candidatus Roizmanbacteria bacterium RIFOXYB2_FULL_38_10]OGK70317.1 MAG: hypothetical protein A3K21_04795 [Candidatus Roizmanbacteria ba